jgi:hypothetical protein
MSCSIKSEDVSTSAHVWLDVLYLEARDLVTRSDLRKFRDIFGGSPDDQDSFDGDALWNHGEKGVSRCSSHAERFHLQARKSTSALVSLLDIILVLITVFIHGIVWIPTIAGSGSSYKPMRLRSGKVNKLRSGVQKNVTGERPMISAFPAHILQESWNGRVSRKA